MKVSSQRRLVRGHCSILLHPHVSLCMALHQRNWPFSGMQAMNVSSIACCHKKCVPSLMHNCCEICPYQTRHVTTCCLPASVICRLPGCRCSKICTLVSFASGLLLASGQRPLAVVAAQHPHVCLKRASDCESEVTDGGA